jgi:hypothetical protein
MSSNEKELTKEEIKKLEILNKYTSKEIEELLKQTKLSTKKEVKETIGEN